MPRPPAAAALLFGPRLPAATRYVEWLVGAGVVRGLVGPREADRIWDRHVLNCAVVAELVPQSVALVDVGSGAGLPGIVLAIVRPDLTVTLVEPQHRRVEFLVEVVRGLTLPNVVVRRARAEELPVDPLFEVATARAVAPLDRLASWALPLLAPGGRLLAIKGRRAAAELAGAQPALRRFGVRSAEIRRCGGGVLETPTTVVDIVAGQRRALGAPRRPRS